MQRPVCMCVWPVSDLYSCGNSGGVSVLTMPRLSRSYFLFALIAREQEPAGVFQNDK